MGLDGPRKYTQAEVARHAAYFRVALDLYASPVTSQRFTAFCDIIDLLAAESRATAEVSPQTITLAEQAQARAIVYQRIRSRGANPIYRNAYNNFTKKVLPTLYQASIGIMFNPDDPRSRESTQLDIIDQLAIIRNEVRQRQAATN